ncbi:MAG TPA: PhoU domain-containing protein, partial [Candidatus Nanoarchaeia archaeon]|nr:PhoU domain-containing protein [Candidatus Nanoarchaeia archaeon]
MIYRKLIKFGDSSFVISLPKEWIEKNVLKKGDVIGIEIGSKNELYVIPKSKPDREPTEIKIDLDKIDSPEGIRTSIISAYLRNFDIIKITGSNLIDHSQNIRNYIHDLASVEIMEQDHTKITARCFFNSTNISIYSLIRRLDIMTRSMLNDAKASIKSDNLLDYAYQKETDVTRLTFLILRTLRKSLNEPELASALKLQAVTILEYWQLVDFLEDIADHAKRVCKHLARGPVPDKEKLEKLFDVLIEHYENAMKAYYTDNKELA